MRNPNSKSSRRFTSEKTAKDFAKTVKGNLKDLRGIPNSKSNFKVEYTKENAHKGMSNYHSLDDVHDPYDDDFYGDDFYWYWLM